MELNLASKFGIAASIATIVAILGGGISWDVNEHLTVEKRFATIQQDQQGTNDAVRVLAAELSEQKQELVERLLRVQNQEREVQRADAVLHRELKQTTNELVIAEKANLSDQYGYGRHYAADMPSAQTAPVKRPKIESITPDPNIHIQ